MEHEKNYELLRPFDLEAAKAGEAIMGKDDGESRTFITGPDKHGYFVVESKEGWYRFGKPEDYRMAPLAWVEGKPVYKGDVLYWNSKTMEPGSKFTVGAKLLDHDMIEGVSVTTRGKTYDSPGTGLMLQSLTWTKPKTQREAWLNIYPNGGCSGNLYDTEEAANKASDPGRLACIHIEWEE